MTLNTTPLGVSIMHAQLPSFTHSKNITGAPKLKKLGQCD